jgi:hypothetical protein
VIDLHGCVLRNTITLAAYRQQSREEHHEPLCGPVKMARTNDKIFDSVFRRKIFGQGKPNFSIPYMRYTLPTLLNLIHALPSANGRELSLGLPRKRALTTEQQIHVLQIPIRRFDVEQINGNEDCEVQQREEDKNVEVDG